MNDASRCWAKAFAFAVLIFLSTSINAPAQKKEVRAQGRKLPAPEKIVEAYLKAVGGKKRQVEVRDAVYEYDVLLKEQAMGRARTQVKAPAAVRTDTIFGNGEINAASNGRSAWERGLDGSLRTLTDAEGNNAKLQAALSASRLVNYKKLNVLVRTVSLEETGGEPAYVLEFSSRNGARLRYWFGATSRLLLKVEDATRRLTLSYLDYRAENGLLEPHRLESQLGQTGALTFVLKKASYNTGIADKIFDPPSAEALDIPALLRELAANQRKVDERVSEYSFIEKRTEREINGRGEVTKEKTSVFEVYPLEGGGSIYKLVSENGLPLSPEKMAEQEKRIAESVARHEREREKKKQKEASEAAKQGGEAKKQEDDKDDVGISTFLRACEFVSPRKEKRGERESVVFDFRPRVGFRPSNTAESIVAKLVGVIWIDPVDKEVIRLEARLAEGFKVGGGLIASIRPGSAFVFEQLRLPEGVWLPRFVQANLMAKVFIFKGIEANETREFSGYKRYSTETDSYHLEAPKQENDGAKKP